jgi:2-oxoglutarate dehydrogenase E2 component (dihydrolipoamide succinyltransferase)
VTIEIRVPQLPESVADATLVAWHKQPGDAIKRDENLADLETDKVVLEVPAPTNGILRELKVESGTTVTSGQVLAVIEEGGTASATAGAAPTGTSASSAPGGASKAPSSSAASGGSAAAKSAPTTSAASAAKSSPATSAATNGGGTSTDASKLSPSVRRLVEENKLDPSGIPASGRDGRLTKSDVVDYLDKQGGASATSPGTGVTAPTGRAPSAPAAKPTSPSPSAPRAASSASP